MSIRCPFCPNCLSDLGCYRLCSKPYKVTPVRDIFQPKGSTRSAIQDSKQLINAIDTMEQLPLLHLEPPHHNHWAKALAMTRALATKYSSTNVLAVFSFPTRLSRLSGLSRLSSLRYSTSGPNPKPAETRQGWERKIIQIDLVQCCSPTQAGSKLCLRDFWLDIYLVLSSFIDMDSSVSQPWLFPYFQIHHCTDGGEDWEMWRRFCSQWIQLDLFLSKCGSCNSLSLPWGDQAIVLYRVFFFHGYKKVNLG